MNKRKTTKKHDECPIEEYYSLQCLYDIVRELDERITKLEKLERR